MNEDGQLYCYVRVWKLRQGEVTSPTQGCSSVKWLSQDGGPRCCPQILPDMALGTKASGNKELTVCRAESQHPPLTLTSWKRMFL